MALRGAVRETILKHDPESLKALELPVRQYAPMIRAAAGAIEKERRGLTHDGLARLLAFTQHVHFGTWSRPFEVLSIHHKMAAQLIPQLKRK